jgi:hypothetical protein
MDGKMLLKLDIFFHWVSLEVDKVLKEHLLVIPIIPAEHDK